MNRDPEKARAWRQRSKPLGASTPLRTTKPINPTSAKRRKAQAERTRTINAIKRAAHGPVLCVYGFTGCTRYADDANEVLTRARGGSITDAANIRPGCRSCHEWLHHHPAEAHDLGLMPHAWEAQS